MTTLLNQSDFLAKYHIALEDYQSTGLHWSQLEALYVDYEPRRKTYLPILRYLQEQLSVSERSHSVRARVKDAEHLVEKVIRKHIDQAKSADGSQRKELITVNNYRQLVADLLGLRVLHLFKEEWLPIHDFISSTWELTENPVANVREGDADDVIQTFRDRGCTIHKHPKGYRSIHYIIRVQLGKDPVVAEVQVRTIFEEAWSEIDHAIRYPYGADHLVSQYLAMFNRLAGSADEMGSYVQHLNGSLQKMREEQSRQMIEWEREKVESRAALEKLKKLTEHSETLGKEKVGMQKQIHELQQRIDSLTKPSPSFILQDSSFGSDVLRALVGAQSSDRLLHYIGHGTTDPIWHLGVGAGQPSLSPSPIVPPAPANDAVTGRTLSPTRQNTTTPQSPNPSRTNQPVSNPPSTPKGDKNTRKK